MDSIISFPERGPWGKSRYRGNCSGHVFVELIRHYMPDGKGVFVDVTEGGGTSREVCKQMFPNVRYFGLDLKNGFDFTRMAIRHAIRTPADICFSHPPYHNMIVYSGNMWGDANENDISRCQSEDEFLAKCQVMLLNQRDATRPGGIYCTLIGDLRKNGHFASYQADFLAMMPRNERRAVIIKTQHNCVSDGRRYARMKHPRILHEYLLVWEREAQSIVAVVWEQTQEMLRKTRQTWQALVRMAIMVLGGKATLDAIYQQVEKIAGEKLASNPTWKATVRRELQQHFTRIERGVWAV